MEYNISHEASDMKVTENTKIFIVTEFETLSRTYRISGVNSRKEAQEFIENVGLDNYNYNQKSNEPQCTEIGEREWEASKVKKIEMQRVSPCAFYGTTFEGYEKHWIQGRDDYKNSFTCSNNIKGTKSSVCTHCMRKIRRGYTIVMDN